MKQHLEQWREVETRLAQKHAPFTMFALFLYEDSPRPNQWDVIMAAPWLNRHKLPFLRDVDRVIKEVFDVTVPTDHDPNPNTYHRAFTASIFCNIGHFHIVDMDDPDLPALLELIAQEQDAQGVLELHHRHLLGEDVARAFILSAHPIAQLVGE